MQKLNFDEMKAPEALREINDRLEVIKQDLSNYMMRFHEAKTKMVMFIEDKKTNPSRGQSEEIEPEFAKMKFLDPEL